MDDGTNMLDGASGIAVSWDYAYIAWYNDDGIEIADISDPTSPTHVTSITNGAAVRLDWPRNVHIDGDYLYVSSYDDDSLQVFDISDPTTPTEIFFITNSTDLDGARGIFKSWSFIYMTSELGDGVEVLKEVYYSGSAYISPDVSLWYSQTINSFTGALWINNEWSVTYQISKDGWTTRYYYNGASWAITTWWTSESSSLSVINTNLAAFNALGWWTDQFTWKAFFNSDNTQKVELDELTLQYGDIIDPVITSAFPEENDLLPKHNFNIIFAHEDEALWSGINTASGILDLYRWDGATWGADISDTYIDFTGSTITTSSATYPTLNIGYGKYKMDYFISDNAGNQTSTWVIFYVDEPSLTISTGSVDLWDLSTVSNTFSTEFVLTVETVGAPFDIILNNTTPLAYFWTVIPDWDGSNGFWYDQDPYTLNISAIGVDQVIGTQTGSINTDGNRNSYVYKIKLWALINAEQFWWTYSGNVNFWLNLTY